MANKKKQKNTILKKILLAIAITTFFYGAAAMFAYIYFLNHIYPNVYIDNVNLGGKTKQEAIALLTPKTKTPESITLTYNNQNFDIPIDSLNINFDANKTIKKAVLLGKNNNILLDTKELLSSLENKTVYPIEFSFNKNILDNSINSIAAKINIAPQNGVFTISNNKVTAFKEDSSGLAVDQNKLENEITNGIFKNSSDKINLDIPITTVNAQIKTSDINNLGIKELIGSGTSHFAGSAASRIYNIKLAASRIDNTLIAPDNIFSFDKTVGDISALTGYQQAYIISNGATILGDGGGVCQVSTTMFRAAMNTGLPIVERHAHAYQVHYYEEDAPAGMDATIYSPTVDFKFKNDTANYILIETDFDAKDLSLTFNLYGTGDGRIVNISKPTLWGYIPAPAPLYTDDPNLPVGQVQQVDFAANGLKSQFDYTVTKNGSVINHQTFYSDYQPWQAKYLRGTKTS